MCVQLVPSDLMLALRAAFVILTAALALACDGGSADDPAAEGSGDGSGETAGETEAGAEAALEPEPAAGSAADASLAARVLLAFAADPRVDALDFDASAVDGIVTLTSTTRSATQWSLASTIAGDVDGVVEVRMDSPSPPATDEAEAPTDAPDLAALRALGTRRDAEPDLPEPDADEDAAARAASGDRPRTVRVQAGDSLSIIASRAMGDGNQWHRIYELNRSTIGPNPERLVEGMVLRIPQD